MKWQNFSYMELNLGNLSAMGTNKALYWEWVQDNTGFEVRALCKLVYLEKREEIKKWQNYEESSSSLGTVKWDILGTVSQQQK